MLEISRFFSRYQLYVDPVAWEMVNSHAVGPYSYDAAVGESR